jgi:hypothetical protein
MRRQRAGGTSEKAVLTHREETLRFPTLDFTITLAQVYEDVAV